MRPDGPRDPVAGPDEGPRPPFPIKVNGPVVRGFGRGGAELGIPTANIPLEGLSVGGHEEIESGVYFGWAGISRCVATDQKPPTSDSRYKHMESALQQELRDLASKEPSEANEHTQANGTKEHAEGSIYPMVMSVGWNPFYKNTVRSIEVHIMHQFETDFYGAHMNLMICGFIRPEYDYVSVESLVEDIQTDINVAARSLLRPTYVRLRDDAYLLDFSNNQAAAVS